jgi:5-methyltetrahydropteroyltriglutamate--homocysteine methyltransferase
MSARTVPPFRADHVGSFLRPAKLHAARKQYADGAISAEQLRAVEDEAVREVVALQRST